VAFAVFAVIHSALLTPMARAALEAALGPQRFRGWFRALYSAQAVAFFAIFAVYAASLPDALLLRTGTGATVFLWGVRLAALAFLARCVSDFGFLRFLGLSQWGEWRRGGGPVAGDGVDSGELVVTGPYRWVRHPMYAAALVFLWAQPRWTANGLAFAVGASLYLWLGSLLEERRLQACYGEAYRTYARRTPRLLPFLGRKAV
jgi:protein-S-isoprenylcysteine O-methyltransferase Ste14